MPTVTKLLTSIFAWAGLAFAHLSIASAASVIYDQPPNYPGAFNFLTSSRGINGAGFRTWDSFTLAQTTHITGLTWQGTYRDFVNRSNNPVGTNTGSWEISLWADAGGEPSTMERKHTFIATQVEMTFIGTASVTPFGSNISDMVNVYNFRADLPLPLYATAGTTYWLSILSDAPADNPLWGWMSGTGGDNETIQEALVGSTRFARVRDRVFSLEGASPVPEPGSLAFLAVGLAALFFHASKTLGKAT